MQTIYERTTNRVSFAFLWPSLRGVVDAVVIHHRHPSDVIPSFETMFSARPEERHFVPCLEGRTKEHLLRMNGKAGIQRLQKHLDSSFRWNDKIRFILSKVCHPSVLRTCHPSVLRTCHPSVLLAGIHFLFLNVAHAAEINGSAFATEGAPLPQQLHAIHEKTILVDPNEHAFGAYDTQGHLIRWGIATAGARICADTRKSCKTKIGMFRIYSLGSANCYSRKYNDAPMPFCMYFNGSQAIHGSGQIEFSNISHGCVRVHVADAKWLRYHFAELPSAANYFRGTKIIILPY